MFFTGVRNYVFKISFGVSKKAKTLKLPETFVFRLRRKVIFFLKNRNIACEWLSTKLTGVINSGRFRFQPYLTYLSKTVNDQPKNRHRSTTSIFHDVQQVRVSKNWVTYRFSVFSSRRILNPKLFCFPSVVYCNVYSLQPN